MEQIKAVIIDDEPNARALVRYFCANFPQIEIIGECEDGFAGAKFIHQHNPDLLFLDVQMPRLTGFEMLELIQETPIIIFTTAYDEFALKAFEYNAMDYLLKPFSKERIQKAIEKSIDKISNQRNLGVQPAKINVEIPASTAELNRIAVKVANEIQLVSIDDILYFEACDDYVVIHTEKEQFVKEATLKYYENRLNSNSFVRAHRSHLVAISKIKKLENYEKDSHVLQLINGKELAVSKSGYKLIKEILGI